MLSELHVRNIALIDELHLELGSGLSVLSGETGAGKSLIIDAINFVMGERTAKDIIRTGEQNAVVEACFSLGSRSVAELSELGVSAEDGVLLVSRQINAEGKSQCRINGRTVPLSLLREAAVPLIDVCGQHQNQSLMNPLRHRDILDGFCDEGLIRRIKEGLSGRCTRYSKIEAELSEIRRDERDREQRIEMYDFQLDELTRAKLAAGEEEDLMERKKTLNSMGKMIEAIAKALNLLSDSPDGLGADMRLSRALSLADTIADIDESQSFIAERLENASDELALAIEGLRILSDKETNPDEIDEVEARLDKLYNLKRKYKVVSADALIEIRDDIQEKRGALLNSAENAEQLEKEKAQLEKELSGLCAELSSERKRAAEEIKKSVTANLSDLNMGKLEFAVRIEGKGVFSPEGWDHVEFLIAPNPGEPLKPLAKTASGGEMSRLMLALKNTLIDADSCETYIFDEIDAGVSGRAAQAVAEKLSRIGVNRQILCVSHLPQLAAMADTNYRISKNVKDGKTFTVIEALEGGAVYEEIGRLISGAKITDAGLKAAEEMKGLADQFKQER